MRASASVLLAFALGFSMAGEPAKAPATMPPAATSASSDEATTMLLGDWLGTLDTGEGAAKLRLVLHLGKNPDGTLSGSIDSLDENVKGIPVDRPTFADGTLGLEPTDDRRPLRAHPSPEPGRIEGDVVQERRVVPTRVQEGSRTGGGSANTQVNTVTLPLRPECKNASRRASARAEERTHGADHDDGRRAHALGESRTRTSPCPRISVGQLVGDDAHRGCELERLTSGTGVGHLEE